MLDGVVAAGFEDVVEADEVGFYVGVRICDGIPYAGLGGEVDDDCWFVFLEDFGDEGFVGEVSFDECK